MTSPDAQGARALGPITSGDARCADGTCGHPKHWHGVRPGQAYGTGHGACGVPGCGCGEFVRPPAAKSPNGTRTDSSGPDGPRLISDTSANYQNPGAVEGSDVLSVRLAEIRARRRATGNLTFTPENADELRAAALDVVPSSAWDVEAPPGAVRAFSNAGWTDWGAADDDDEAEDGESDVAIAELEVLKLRARRRRRKDLRSAGDRGNWLLRLDDLARAVKERAAAERSCVEELRGEAIAAAAASKYGKHAAANPQFEADAAAGVYGRRARDLATGDLALMREAAERSTDNAKAIAKASRAQASCRSSHVEAGCPSGHEVAVALACGRPGCDCGAIRKTKKGEGDGGPALQRKVRRALPKLEWSPVWAYIVVPMPPELRPQFRSRDGMKRLHAITAITLRILRPDVAGCMTVNHEFGDETAAYLPHGNALAPLPEGARWKFTKARMREAKAALGAMLGIPAARAVVHYNYIPPERKAHVLRYVLRDTLHPHRDTISDDDLELAIGDMRGFRRVRYHGHLSDRKWGKFQRSAEVQRGYKAHRSKDRAEQCAREMDAGCCPACKAAMSWDLGRGPLDRRKYRHEIVPESDYFVTEATYDAIQERDVEPTCRAAAGPDGAAQLTVGGTVGRGEQGHGCTQ